MNLNRNLRLLLYSSNLWYLGEGMLGPLFAIFAGRIGGDILDITWAWATYLIVTGVLYILVGKLTDGSKKNDTYEWGLAGGEAEIITGIAVIIGGFIVTYFSFNLLFLTMGVIQIISTLYQMQILRGSPFFKLR